MGFTQLVLGKDNYDFISIKPVEINFLQELKLVSSSSDTAQVYANHIKQLIKRDNHHKADTILIGGAMSFTFQKALGYETGKSLVEYDEIITLHSPSHEHGEGKQQQPDYCIRGDDCS